MPWWNKNCTIKWKSNAYWQEYFRLGGTQCSTVSECVSFQSKAVSAIGLSSRVSRSMKNKRKKWRKKDSNIHNNEKAFSDYLDHTIAIYTIATLRIKFYLTVKTQNQEYWNTFRYKAYYSIITRFLATYLAKK